MTDTVLVVGASGLVGTAACLEFKQAGWRVIAASRRVPELLEGSGIEHVPLDLQDGAACAAVVGERLADVTHVVYTAVYEMPGLVDGWLDPQQIDTNDRMLRNLLEPLRKQAKLRHLGRAYETEFNETPPWTNTRVMARAVSQPVEDLAQLEARVATLGAVVDALDTSRRRRGASK